jgi:hypothetical protein
MGVGILVVGGLVSIVWIICSCVLKVVKADHEHALLMAREKSERSDAKE